MATHTNTAPIQQAFFASIEKLAVPYTKGAQAKGKDPLKAAQERFVATCDETIRLIKATADSGRFFKREGESYVIALRNGSSHLKLVGEQTHFMCKDSKAAIAFVEAAKAGAQAGEFNALFTSTARKAKSKEAAA